MSEALEHVDKYFKLGEVALSSGAFKAAALYFTRVLDVSVPDKENTSASTVTVSGGNLQQLASRKATATLTLRATLAMIP